MALEIIWSKRAEKKFDKITIYINDSFGKSTTQSFVRKVFQSLDILAEFPEIGTVENQKENIRGLTIMKNINIFYMIHDKKIYLLDFFDNRQNPSKKRF